MSGGPPGPCPLLHLRGPLVQLNRDGDHCQIHDHGAHIQVDVVRAKGGGGRDAAGGRRGGIGRGGSATATGVCASGRRACR